MFDDLPPWFPLFIDYSSNQTRNGSAHSFHVSRPTVGIQNLVSTAILMQRSSWYFCFFASLPCDFNEKVTRIH